MPLFHGRTPPKQTPAALELDERFQHIAFIMDGNGRWARKRGMPREYGHRAGAETFRKIARHCCDLGFRAVTVYAFSTENWKRPPEEVQAILALMERYLDELERDSCLYHNRFRFIGDLSVFPEGLRERMARAETLNRESPQILNIALNYGGRAELLRAFRTLAAEGKGDPTEEDVARALYTAESGDPDLIVRTGGDLRLSNFLLWQAAYAELYFTDTLWPDLTTDDVDRIVREFYQRKRRFGAL